MALQKQQPLSSDSKISFEAILGQTTGAIRIHGDSGFRLTLDVDDSGTEAIKRLVDMRGKNLHIEVSEA